MLGGRAPSHMPFRREASSRHHFPKMFSEVGVGGLNKSNEEASLCVSPAPGLPPPPPPHSPAHVLPISPLATAMIRSLPPVDVAQQVFLPPR